MAGSFVGGLVSGVGDVLGAMVNWPGTLGSMIDTISNMSASDILDGVQVALDVVGFIPVVGEIADGINGVIHLARGNYADAALSFTSMIPVVGDAIGKGGKAAKFLINKADDILAAGKWVKCKVTGKGCFVAGTKVWVSATVDASVGSAHANLASSPFRDSDPTKFTEVALLAGTIDKQSIETVAIGSRVAGENPRPWEYDGEFSEPDSATWSLARFSLQKEDGSWIDVEMIRPAEYWEQQGAVPGELTYVEFPELEASGLAKVTSIEPCPPIASGTGQVVTARIVTRQVAELVEIEFVGGETLAGTPQHPIWSIERQDWVELGELEVGEHLWTEAGPIEISSTRLLSTGESVYNLEVHGHHIYQVTELGVLVHNAGGIQKYNSGWIGKLIKSGRKIPDAIKDSARLHGHHIVMKAKFWGKSWGRYVRGSQEILRRAGININDLRNLAIAINQ
ncbi:polymorphic toxin-type HINT domain-containing protein [Pirellulaceae bacterium SH449]